MRDAQLISCMHETRYRHVAGAVAAALLWLALVVAPAPARHGEAANGAGNPEIKRFPLPTVDARPLGLTVGPDGNVWFVEFLGNKVGRITRPGHVDEFPIPTPNSTPDAIVTGSDGNLWFTEVAGNKIGRITPEGVITEFPVPTPNAQPTVITAGPDGNLWFTERGRPHPAGAFDVAKVGRITTEGVITEFEVPTRGSRPVGIAGGPDGNVWFTLSMVDKVARITPDGVVTEFALPRPCPPPRCSPHEITGGPDGAVWFTEVFGNRIGRITPSGEITEFDLPHPRSAPNVITRGPAGTVVFTESGLTAADDGRIGAMRIDGELVEWDLPLGTSPFGITTGSAGEIWFAETGTLANPGETISLIVGGHGQLTAAFGSGHTP